MARLRPRLTFANVISVIALFVALGGGAIAATKLKRNSVKSKHIAPDAVQGVDANESSFGTVPSASRANTAINADNANNIDGINSDDLQFGNGTDDAIAGTVDETETGGIAVFEGAVGIECDASPTVVYDDFGGDGGVETDLWVNGAHQLVADDGLGAPVSLPGAPDDTAQVHIWGGGGTVASVVASVNFDATAPASCALAFTSQENLDTGAFGASAGARDAGDRSRGELPEGWVTLGG